jgi:hypothetical protein
MGLHNVVPLPATGCGKTSLWQRFRDAGYAVLDEAFLDMPPCPYALHPQSLLMETSWVVTVSWRGGCC